MERRIGRDAGLQARMFLTLFLLAVVYAAFVAVLLRLGVNAVAVACVVALLLGMQYAFSDRLVLLSIGAREVSEQEEPQLHDMVARIAQLAGLPKPRIAVVETAAPNALATGRNPQHALVVVTRGLIGRLEPAELEAVLAHELSHVLHRDVQVMLMATFFSTVASFIVQTGMWGGYGGGGHGRNRGGSFALVLLVAAVVWLISFVLIRTLSRYREYAADQGSAQITGEPTALASALLKIADDTQRIPDRDLRQVEGASALLFFPAFSSGSLAELFSTHPSVEHRVARLEAMQAKLEA
jgi:heat shock protein HtpX